MKALLQLRGIFVLMILISVIACRQQGEMPVYNLQKSIVSDSAVVVSAHPMASKIGIDILKQGGNAVDAAIATQFALAVSFPYAGNIGGGGFMVIRLASGEVSTLDYREKAPSAAFTEMYLDSMGNAISELSRYGHLSIGVPGTVDGLEQAFNKYSKLKDWKRLVQPALDLARNGFKLTGNQVKYINQHMPSFKKYNTTDNVIMEKEEWKKGDLFVQEELAKVLEAIRDNGRSGFYEGWVAEKIVAEMERGNGLITLEDLKNYRAAWREPIRFNYKDYEIITMPPPSSGGVALAQLFGMVEPYPLSEWGFQSQKSVHLMVEAERRVYADRAQYLGDMDFYPVPIAGITDKEYLAHRMSDFDETRASRSEHIDYGIPYENGETTHFSIIDEEGNAISSTATLNSPFGSKVIAGGTGIMLNNEMDDFSSKPGVPNIYGMLGSEANKIEPGKRMLSSMTPTIVTKDGKPKIIVGTPGGSTIITSVFQVILNIIEWDMSTEEAVHSNRFHHQWYPDSIRLEEGGINEETMAQLKAMGHKFYTSTPIGRVEAIVIRENGDIEGVADTRRDDHAEGF
jgi:gamma-glutamyltranspeptidase/glutathione hydrolase